MTELLGACPAKRDVTEDTDAVLPWVGVPGADAAGAPEPNKRRVDEKRRDGSLREEEYYQITSAHMRSYRMKRRPTDSFHSSTHFSIHGIRLMTRNSRMNRPTS